MYKIILLPRQNRFHNAGNGFSPLFHTAEHKPGPFQSFLEVSGELGIRRVLHHVDVIIAEPVFPHPLVVDLHGPFSPWAGHDDIRHNIG